MLTPDVKPTQPTIGAYGAEPSAARRPGVWRYFFIALAWLYAVVAVVGFAPNFRDHLAGTYEIHPLAFVHGAIMTAWLALFIAQTSLAASGSMKLHRKLGIASLGLASLIWISMIIATRRPLVAEALPMGHFLFDVLLVQLMVIILFPLYFICGFLARRQPDTHKRLMIFSIAVILQAATDRMYWLLPTFGLPDHWGQDMYVYALLLPLFVFDFVSIGRIHRVTLICTATLISGHAVLNALWGSPAWHHFAFTVTNAMR